MLCRLLLSALFSINLLHASIFDWSAPLSPKAERARFVLEGMDPLIEKALKDFNIPGLAIGVVIDGHVVLAKGYGVRDVDAGTAVNAQTIFPIGSCTKSFTTFAFGMLAEQGLLGWDKIVSDVLPEFRLWDEYASQHATFRDLVAHRTGLSRHDFMWYNSTTSREELLRKARYLEPIYPFRERYHYNSLMYVITAMAIEKASGKTWEEFMRANILNPLKMHSTNFSIEELQNSSNIASPYIDKGRGQIKKVAYRAFNNVAPTAAMNSNVNDLNHWMKMLLSHGTYNHKRLISAGSIQEMQSPQIISSGYPELSELLINSYGLGWDILSYRGHYCVGHDGGVDGFTSALCLLPHSGIGVVVLSNKNRASLPRYVVYEIFDRVLELPLRGWLQLGLETVQKTQSEESPDGKKENKQRKQNTALSHPLLSYEGFYEHPAYGVLTIEKRKEQLYATLHGITYVLDHWHYNVFNIAEEFPDILFSRQGEKVCFSDNISGDVDEVAISFDWGTPPIRFKKKPDEKLSNLSYFRQFTGAYQFYNLVVEVAIQDRALVAMMPGQPLYELNPTSENEFQVREKPGYSIRFVKRPDGTIEEVQLIPPYGGTFSARPKV